LTTKEIPEVKKKIIIAVLIILIIYLYQTSLIFQKYDQTYYGENENWTASYENNTTIYKLGYTRRNHGTQLFKLEYKRDLSEHYNEQLGVEFNAPWYPAKFSRSIRSNPRNHYEVSWNHFLIVEKEFLTVDIYYDDVLSETIKLFPE